MVRLYSEDFGRNYGLQPVVETITQSNNNLELESFANLIRTNSSDNPVTIGDWGGGNGLLSQSLISLSPSSNLDMTIIDADTSKLVDGEKVRNVCADIKNYKPTINFDYSMAKNVLHYMDYSDNSDFLRNMFNHTNEYSLIVNFIIDEYRRKEWGEFEQRLKINLNIERHYQSYNTIHDLINNGKGRVVQHKSLIINNFDYYTFYKNRFGLSDIAADKLKKTGVLEISDYHTAIFLIKHHN